MKPGAVAAALLCLLSVVPHAPGANPSIAVQGSARFSTESLVGSGREQVKRLRLLAALARSEAEGATVRGGKLKALFDRGKASAPEVQSTSFNAELCRDRAETLRLLADEIDAALDKVRADGTAVGPTLHFKLPPLSRGVGSLEFFTLPVSDGWAPVTNAPPPTDLVSPAEEDIWAKRLAELRLIPSIRPSEIAQAERNRLASRTSTQLFEFALAQHRREVRDLRAFACSSPEKRLAWSLTREDFGVFVSSWHRPVPCTERYLRASLPILEAQATARGALELRQAEEAQCDRRVESLRTALEKGLVGKITLQHAEADLLAAQARARAERSRIRLREMELSLFRRLAKACGLNTVPCAVPTPCSFESALHQAVPLESSWTHGLFQLLEKRTLADLDLRSRKKGLDRATNRLASLQKLRMARPSELAKAEEELRIATAHHQIASEESRHAALEWAQWISVAGTGPESADATGVPASILIETAALAEAELEARRLWAESFQPESLLQEDVVAQIESLHKSGSASAYELAVETQQAILAKAKWTGARHEVAVASEQRRLMDLLVKQGKSVLDAAGLGEPARASLLTVNELLLQPRASEIQSLRAAATIASMRAQELNRLVQSGYATPHEARRELAAADQYDHLAKFEEARAEVASLTKGVLGASFALPSPILPEFHLPPLE
ncbi:MAG: hypothetical protein DVB23_000870 [Verrucomicrobia bacterium]|nr:MAG: hypothetical protein DVB23_000870 [Verrucomicrobiota bacterium]